MTFSSDDLDDELTQIVHLIDLAFSQGELTHVLELCLRFLEQKADHHEMLFLTAETYRALGQPNEAIDYYATLKTLTPDHAPTRVGLADCLFDQFNFDDAQLHVNRAIRLNPNLADAYLLRAKLRERRSDHHGAQRDYQSAFFLEPDAFPKPVLLSDNAIQQLIEEIFSETHPSLQDYFIQLNLLFEDVPSEEICRLYEPPAPPGEILLFHSASPAAPMGQETPWSNLPPALLLFRCNIHRFAQDPDELKAILTGAFSSEISAFLGVHAETELLN